MVFSKCYFETVLQPKWIIVQKRAIGDTGTQSNVDLKSTKMHCRVIAGTFLTVLSYRFSYLVGAGFFEKSGMFWFCLSGFIEWNKFDFGKQELNL